MKKSTKAEEDIMKFIGSKKITLALVSGLILFLSACGVSATPDETLTAQGDFICRGLVTAVNQENVIVPSGASCTLENVTITGNILVEPRGALVARTVNVGGSVQADGHTRVTVTTSSRVTGDIQIKQGGSARVVSTRVGGTLEVESNVGTHFLSRNTVSGDMKVNANTGVSTTIQFNRINGNLQCQDNLPAPVGSGNTASLKEDQCQLL
jgi:hypothetical protein